MVEFKGTKGKWSIPKHRDNIVNDEKGFHIATVWIAGIGNDNQLYNTKLIAAAPELLEVLQGLVSDVGNLLSEHNIEWQQAGYYETAKELIKKATE